MTSRTICAAMMRWVQFYFSRSISSKRVKDRKSQNYLKSTYTCKFHVLFSGLISLNLKKFELFTSRNNKYFL